MPQNIHDADSLARKKPYGEIIAVFGLIFSLLAINFYNSNAHIAHYDASLPLALTILFVLSAVLSLLVMRLLPAPRIAQRIILAFALLVFLYLFRDILKSLPSYLPQHLLRAIGIKTINLFEIVFWLSWLSGVIWLNLRRARIILSFLMLGGLVQFGILTFSDPNPAGDREIINAYLRSYQERAAKMLSLAGSQKRNIWILIADGYPSQELLRDYYNNANQDFYTQMERLGFHFYRPSYSNYHRTFPSMEAMFDMRHHYLRTTHFERSDSALTGAILSGCNPVMEFLRLNGYTSFALFPIGSFHACNNEPTRFRMAEPERDVHRFFTGFPHQWRSFVHRFMESVLPRRTLAASGEAQKDSSDGGGGHLRLIPVQTTGAFAKATRYVLKQEIETPYFAYIHDFGGVSGHYCNDNPELYDTFRGFLNQTECVSQDALTAIAQIAEKDPEAIVIFAADHAKWRIVGADSAYRRDLRTTYQIVTAIKWPAPCRHFEKAPRISQVNFMRYVFACIREDAINQAELEPDISIGFETRKTPVVLIRDGIILDAPEAVKQTP